MIELEYVLPLRWTSDDGLDELTDYLSWLCCLVDVTVVDGSPPDRYAIHAARWRGLVRHTPPDPAARFANGKVNGVVTGVALARHEHVLIADDDVRYDEAGLRAVAERLAVAHLVRPQNYFAPLPWHARWDTARSLLNRSFGADYPGTLGIRRSTFAAMGGYDGDVLFENLELIRTVRAHGGAEAHLPGCYVRRLPPDPRRFWSQRVRQAYDDFAQPVRLMTFLAVLPALAGALAGRRPGPVLGAAAGAVVLAEVGRRRAGGAAVFPATTSLMAPVWILERAACSWAALGQRVLYGGVRYSGRRLRVAAHSQRELVAAQRGAGAPARNLTTLCVPSQNGLIADLPQRHSATVSRRGSMVSPSGVNSAKSPRTSSGPSS